MKQKLQNLDRKVIVSIFLNIVLLGALIGLAYAYSLKTEDKNDEVSTANDAAKNIKEDVLEERYNSGLVYLVKNDNYEVYSISLEDKEDYLDIFTRYSGFTQGKSFFPTKEQIHLKKYLLFFQMN